MKISNNALNFLLAQYRAIFKRAYIKGIASAVILTAGLAAGQAQAASEAGDYYVQDNNANWTLQGGFRDEWPQASGGNVAGAYEDKRAPAGSSDGKLDGLLSGGTLVVGASGTTSSSKDQADIGKANIAMGAYLYATGNTTISDFVVNDNQISLLSGGTVNNSAQGAWVVVDKGNITSTGNSSVVEGGTVGGHTYGAYLQTSGGNINATGNHVDVNLEATASATLGSTYNSGVYGAYLKSEKGSAFASGNYVTVTAAVDKDNKSSLTLNSGAQITGAAAFGTDTVTVTGNYVNLSVDGAKNTDRIEIGEIYGVIGGSARNNTADTVAKTLTVTDNHVSISNFSLAGNEGPTVYGGYTSNAPAATVASELLARNNTVTLTNTDITAQNTSAGRGPVQVVGNYAIAVPTTAPTTGQNSVSAIGDGTQVNMSINGGTIQFTSASDLDSTTGLNPNSMIAGGYAQTVSGGGNATANLNVADIKNLTGINVNLYGAVAYNDKAVDDDQVTASQNRLTIDASNLTVDGTAANHTANNIAGAVARLYKGSSNLTDKTALTANSNAVSITNSAYKAAEANTVKRVDADIFGAMVDINDSGATVAASQNTVTVGNDLDVNGSVYGVRASHNGTYTDNKVDFNADLVAQVDSTSKVVAESITGVTIVNGDTKASGATENVKLTVTGNTVTVGADAKLENVNIQAVSLANNNAKDTDVIHSGNNVTVNGDYLVNDSAADVEYALAGDDVQISSTAQIYVKEGTLNISGIANGAATPEYYNGTGTVAAGAQIANADTINVYNSLDVQGDDSLFAVSNGAQLNIDGGSAADEDDEDAVTTEKATLKISQTGLTNYLTATKDLAYDLDGDAQQVKEAQDAAGAVTVTSGGTIDFKDSVLLSAFDFTSGGATPGKINVDTALTGGSGSYFKADTVTVAHKLATNTTTAQGKYGNLVELGDTSGVAIEAKTLNLGSDDLSSTRSAAITFGKATVKEEINFLARTSGKDIADDAAGTELPTFNDGYHLTSEVIGSNFMLTNDQYSNEEYYTSLAGNINGVVTVEGDNGLIHIKDGDWTANDLVTVTSGGNITVGSGTESSSIETGSQPDATLNLAAGLVLDASKTGTATVTANGDHGSAYQKPDDFYGDYRYVALDLTNGVEMKGDAETGDLDGKAVIEATSGGVVLMTASDVNDLLAQNHAWNDKEGGTNNNKSGAFLNASAGGELRVDGDITAQFRDFDNDANTNGFYLTGTKNTVDEGNTNVVNDKTSGRLVADSLTIVNPHSGTVQDDAEYLETAAKKVYLGGAVIVDDLEINDLQQTNGEDKPEGSNTYASQVTIADGGALISHSLTSYNDKLILGDGTDSAILYFETDTVGVEGTISVNKIELASGSEIDFANGEWDASATDFNLSGAGSSLIVGDDYDTDVNDNPYSATLVAGNLTMGADTSLRVAANGIRAPAS